jgi:hypothetical protein
MGSDAPPARYEAGRSIRYTADDQLRASRLTNPSEAQPRWIKRRASARVEVRKVDRMRSAVGYQLGHCLAGRRCVEDTPDAVASGYIGTLDARDPPDQRQAVLRDRAIAGLPRDDLCRSERR